MEALRFGRGAVAFGHWLLILALRLLAFIVWAAALVGVFLAYQLNVIVGAIVTVPFVLVWGLVVYALRRRDREQYEWEEERLRTLGATSSGGGGFWEFVLKVIIALIIVVVFFKYFVQIRLVPQLSR